MREQLICANWKMYKTLEEVRAFVTAFLPALEAAAPGKEPLVGEGAPSVVLFPASLFLGTVGEGFANSPVHVGAQCCHQEPKGAFTGAVSCEMVVSVGAKFVLVGHSERRWVFKEQDDELNLQLKSALRNELRPILCVGESLAEREDDQTLPVIERQLTLGLAGVAGGDVSGLVIAYEPVWAIGTGRTATAAQAQEVHESIRQTLAKSLGDEVAKSMPVVYGGSVKP
ncbi:triose-phosphate isomerase, partial [Planctomycetota bacterium]